MLHSSFNEKPGPGLVSNKKTFIYITVVQLTDQTAVFITVPAVCDRLS
jgi:hypothetical protein